MLDKILTPALLWVVLIIFGAFMLWMLFRSISKWIIKVPPDKAAIVYGAFTKSRVTIMRKVPEEPGVGKHTSDDNAYSLIKTETDVSFRIVRGGATLVIPLLQSVKYLDLGLITLEVKVEDVPSIQAVPITVDGIAQIKIGGDETYIATAAEQLLDKDSNALRHVVQETLMGHLRAIIGIMTVEDTFKNREMFSQRVQEVAVEDIAGMGIEIKSFVIKDIDDKQGYIKALGATEIQGKLRDERIATANAAQTARETEATADLAAQTAEINRDKQVIKQLEAKELMAVAKDREVQMAEAKRDEEVQKLRAMAIQQEKQASVIVPAEAEAKAKKIVADGEKQKITVTAEAEAQATRMKAGAEAEATTVKGEAEAAANKAKLLAEADGVRAGLNAEADGKLRLAEAIAAEGQINVLQYMGELIINGEVKKAEALAAAIGRLGENIKIVQFAGGEGGIQENALMKLLGGIPEFATVFNAKTEALAGMNAAELLEKAVNFVKTGESFANVKTSESDKPEKVNKSDEEETKDNTPGVGKLPSNPMEDDDPVKKVRKPSVKKGS